MPVTYGGTLVKRMTGRLRSCITGRREAKGINGFRCLPLALLCQGNRAHHIDIGRHVLRLLFLDTGHLSVCVLVLLIIIKIFREVLFVLPEEPFVVLCLRRVLVNFLRLPKYQVVLVLKSVDVGRDAASQRK